MLYNSAILIGPEGDLVEVYNKVHLRGEERMAFREGFKIPVIETEIGTLGLMIGYDSGIPGSGAQPRARRRGDRLRAGELGSRPLSTSGRPTCAPAPTRTAVFMVGANRIGEDVTLTFGGESMIVGPRGEIHASLAGETDEETGAPLEGFTVARIDLDEVRRNREEYQLIQNRQPTVYRSIVRRY